MATYYEIEAIRHTYMRQKNYAALKGFDACLRLFSVEDEGDDTPKKPSFWQRHKGKIIGAAALAAGVAGGAMGANYYRDVKGFSAAATSILNDIRSFNGTLYEFAEGPLKRARQLVSLMKDNPSKVTNGAKQTLDRALSTARQIVSEKADGNSNNVDFYYNLIQGLRNDLSSINVNAALAGAETTRNKLRELKGKITG